MTSGVPLVSSSGANHCLLAGKESGCRISSSRVPESEQAANRRAAFRFYTLNLVCRQAGMELFILYLKHFIRVLKTERSGFNIY
jgi:hypothetical protein